jgi:hypothetical protein
LGEEWQNLGDLKNVLASSLSRGFAAGEGQGGGKEGRQRKVENSRIEKMTPYIVNEIVTLNH